MTRDQLVQQLVNERYAPVDQWLVELPVSPEDRATREDRLKRLCINIDGYYIDDRPAS